MSHDTQRRDPLDTASAPAGYQPRNCIQVDPEMRFNPYILRKAVYLPPLTVPVNRRGPGGRWREYGILLGLWLLVMLVATVVIFRGMDLAAETGRRADRAGAEPATRASQEAPPASGLAADDDPFDEPLPVLPPFAAASLAPSPDRPRPSMARPRAAWRPWPRWVRRPIARRRCRQCSFAGARSDDGRTLPWRLAVGRESVPEWNWCH